ncbi:hypothetical protein AVEN_54372-1 [Araneus ventricosus]|uniref:Uncharacterized protein n=1 Tax=Araneus ventricosus TaxID=182803 RepID=A0A4Y2FUW3_ARAVE|nr:hypothetical protein AVEN_54372-1 [Araneus ventricosus]
MGHHARPTRGGNLLSMRSRKQTMWHQFLIESSLVCPRRKEKSKNSKERNGKRSGFNMLIEHPHMHVIKFCQLVKANKDLAKTSYMLATTRNLHSALFLAAEAQEECRKVEHVTKVAYALKNSPIHG